MKPESAMPDLPPCPIGACTNGVVWNAGTTTQTNCPVCRPGWGAR